VPAPPLAELAIWRRAVEEVAACAEPTVRFLTPIIVTGSVGLQRRQKTDRQQRERFSDARASFAVLPGAYNPPTRAHLALADAARARGFDRVLFSLGTITLDKRESGLALDERLHLLAEITSGQEGLGVVLHNRGLYAEQAEALRRACPGVELFTFVVGMDKVGQIFDARYYRDLESSLAALFDRARLLVAPRGALDHAAFASLLADEPARRYADRVDWLELDPRWRALSATAVRERMARGEPAAEWLPEPVARYLRQRGPIFTP
jgi:nicotinic acid mononucleotide adenylyltransferase